MAPPVHQIGASAQAPVGGRAYQAALCACVALALLGGCAAPRPTSRSSASPAEGDPEWHYEGATGPEHWGALSPAFRLCGEGRRQSPIDIRDAMPEGQTPALQLRFPAASLRIAHHEHVADGINNGHTIQINYDDGDTLTVGPATYPLVQYHFHHPSEHTVDGRRYPMEMHMVHRAADGAMAVVGVLIEEGPHNAAFDPVWVHLPERRGEELHYEHITVDVDALLPARHNAYRYEGSLTTPPCTEGVNWFVLADPIALDRGQIRAFEQRVADNNRPIQPRNGRAVLVDVVH